MTDFFPPSPDLARAESLARELFPEKFAAGYVQAKLTQQQFRGRA